MLAGLWVPLFFLISGIYEAITGNGPELPEYLSLVLLGLTAIGLVGLGSQLQAERESSLKLKTAS